MCRFDGNDLGATGAMEIAKQMAGWHVEVLRSVRICMLHVEHAKMDVEVEVEVEVEVKVDVDVDVDVDVNVHADVDVDVHVHVNAGPGSRSCACQKLL